MIKKLIEIADLLCEGYKDSPSGCEGCPLWDSEEYEKDEENWKCDFLKILDERDNKNGRV